MDDSDDYFDDGFELDEAALASIQATEEHYNSLTLAPPTSKLQPQSSSQPKSRSGSPPLKRLKTFHQSVVSTAANGIVSRQQPLHRMESMDLNPDIRVGPDGNYVITPRTTIHSKQNEKLKEKSDSIGEVVSPIVSPSEWEQAFREAQDALLVKSGEVSILREIIDKTKKEYADAAAKAKADAMAYEKAKLELQAKLKDETERMATRLVFKQHELETSTRKPSWGSARSRRVAKEMQSTIVATPTRTRGSLLLPSTIRSVNRSPAKSDRNKDEDEGPLSSPSSMRKPARSREDLKPPRFKGFHNAFLDSTEPVAKLSPRSNNVTRDSDNIGSDDQGFQERQNNKVPFPDVPEMAENMMDLDNREDSGEFSLVADTAEEEIENDRENDRGDELRRIIFSHIAPQNDTLTLHILFSTVLPPEVASSEKAAYAMSCQIILETCGARHGLPQSLGDSDWESEVVDKVAIALMTVCRILNHSKCIVSLVALLNLVTTLILHIPAFLSPFLRPAPKSGRFGLELDRDGPSQLFCLLSDILTDHVSPPNVPYAGIMDDGDEEEKLKRSLAMLVVECMECLCWNVSDHLKDQLTTISQQQQIWEILLHPGQVPELIARTLQLLILLATHTYAVRFLLTPSNEVDEVDGLSSESFSRIPLVEKLCRLLVELPIAESYRICRLIATFISLISEVGNDVCKLLINSISLAPSLVICITKLSRVLWEEDETVMYDAEVAKLTVDTLYSTVIVLHHLLFVLGLSSLLGRKLVEASRLPGSYNGVTHMFIVTFGRLAWAEGPGWLTEECKRVCEVIAELAMEIIEVVVAGPECDSLWAVWHQQETIEDDIEDDT